MDVMKPEVYWIGNRCYRVNPSSSVNQNNYASYHIDDEKPERDSNCTTNSLSVKPYVEVDEFEDVAADDDTNADLEVIKEDAGFKAVCTIPSTLFPHIIGSKGAVKKRIEAETRTRIFVPRQNEKGDVVVRGESSEAVRKSFKRLVQIASNARFKREATHFACFTMNTPSVIERAKEFKKKVLEECGLSQGLEENIFQEPERLHLTICILFLLDERERRYAADVLNDLEPEVKNIIAGQDLSVKLKGLEIMNDDPSQVDVLYAKCEPVENSDALQRVANLVSKKFAEKGLGREPKGDRVKLHCTVINTRYRIQRDDPTDERRPEENRGKRQFNTRESFDAKAVLKKFGDFDFGVVNISEIKIATRHTKASDGFYKCYSSLSLKKKESHC